MSNHEPPHPPLLPPPPPHHLDHFLKIPRIRLKKHDKQAHHQQQQQQQHQMSNKAYADKGSKYIENTNSSVVLMGMQSNNRAGTLDDNQDNTTTTTTATRIIKPKKLPNPIKDSQAMQSIHKELLLNQKIGRSVLTHKTELQKAIEKLAVKHNTDPEHPASSSSSSSPEVPNPPPPYSVPAAAAAAAKNKNEFQRILDARAKLIEDQKCFVDGESKQDVVAESEFEKIHKRVTKIANKNE